MRKADPRQIQKQAQNRPQGGWRRWVAVIALSLSLAGASLSASPAAADEYDAADAGHPLRIIAYVLHPVGVVIDYVLLRPAHWIGSREPFSTLFGHED
ncbi:MAG: hypothetical protein AB8G23_08430 [Myxococcota bacterium]